MIKGEYIHKTFLNKAFTLIELSIVLIIIGLIVGGILAGNSLINQAHLRSIITEVNNFKSAINAFKLKFDFYPGDFNKASVIWPNCDSATGGGNVPANCNGNTDGKISYSGLVQNEGLRAWSQLSAAGVIVGNYTGFSTVSPHQSDSTNAPYSKYPNGIYALLDTSTVGGNWSSTIRNVIWLGRFAPGSWPWKGILNSIDAYGIDIKIDNGLSQTGKVLGCSDWQCYIAQCSSTVTLTYDFSQTSNAYCAMIFDLE